MWEYTSPWKKCASQTTASAIIQQNKFLPSKWGKEENHCEKEALPSLVHLSFLSAMSVICLLLSVISISVMIRYILELPHFGLGLWLRWIQAWTLLFSFGKDLYWDKKQWIFLKEKGQGSETRYCFKNVNFNVPVCKHYITTFEKEICVYFFFIFIRYLVSENFAKVYEFMPSTQKSF